MLDSTVVCRRALGCEWGGNFQRTHFADETDTSTHDLRIDTATPVRTRGARRSGTREEDERAIVAAGLHLSPGGCPLAAAVCSRQLSARCCQLSEKRGCRPLK